MSHTAKVTNTAVGNRRRSQRVFLKVRVVARFRLLEREWIVDGDTIVVNAHGGTVYLSVAPMAPGDIITLTNPSTDQSETCRVVRIDSAPRRAAEIKSSEPTSTRLVAAMSSSKSVEAMPSKSVEAMPSASVEAMPNRSSDPLHSPGFEVAFAFDRPSPHFWAVAFPPTDWIESLVEH
jgi:hypothetical protein